MVLVFSVIGVSGGRWVVQKGGGRRDKKVLVMLARLNRHEMMFDVYDMNKV